MRTPNARFWHGRRVLVTGHTGFKGSWLTLWLHELGAHVTGLGLEPSTTPAAYHAMGIEGCAASYLGDIRDAALVADTFARSQPEIVLHLAAQPLVARAYAEPAATFDVNVMGTVNVLEAARRTPGVRSIVVVTSDKCYAEHDGGAHTERDPLGGNEPYGASKACAEIVSQAYRETFLRAAGVRLATARAGNVVGGGDWSADRIVTDLVAALVDGRPLNVRAPSATRPWQHVLEPLCGYLLLAQDLTVGRDAAATAWNFGPNAADVASVADFVARFERAWGGSVERTERASSLQERHHLAIDSRAAHELLGWQPRLSLDDAIAWTVEWYRAFAAGTARAKSRRQLERYARLRSAQTQPALAS